VPDAAGYILPLDPSRLELLRERLSIDDRFAQPVAEFDHSRSVPLICFVTDTESQALFIASARRGYAAGTGLRRLNLRSLAPLDPPRLLSRFAERITRRHRARVLERIARGGLLTPKQFRAVVDEIIRSGDVLGDLLERYSSSWAQRFEAISAASRKQLAFQKEAIGTALLLTGIDRRVLLDWAPPDGPNLPRSFLDGLDRVRYHEDPVIFNDLMSFPGFEFIRPVISGATLFAKEDGTHLTIALANRLPLEQLTGADLIYYNEKYRAYVMVQYKMMENDRGAEPIFRLPNAQLDVEVARMEALLTSIGQASLPADAIDFRLSQNPFFLKLCPRVEFHPASTALSPGMYIPLGKWKLLAQSTSSVGRNGGRGITFGNVGRHFDNTSFATLIGSAWVGTAPNQSAAIEIAVRTTLANGRAAVIALSTESRTAVL
jgi:hypothetical protein